MGSLGSIPKAWVPYVNSKDCSQGFCSFYCPQWCYIIFPPPPPSFDEFRHGNSSPNFSPLVIAIIGILASAFLLVSYYTILSKYCGKTNSASRRGEIEDPSEELEHNHIPSFHDHEPWHVPTRGLDEALIKSITVCKYKKGDGLIEGTDCSVCLSEFEEDESLRLLPKCNHAFHVPCVDRWLNSHSNCPLCRANVFLISVSPQLPPIASTHHHESPQNHRTIENEAADDHREQEEIARSTANVAEDEVLLMNNEIPKTPFRALSDPGNLQGRDTIIEIADEGYNPQHIIRRSISMDHSCQSHVFVADILRINQDCDQDLIAGSSKQSSELGKSTLENKLTHCPIRPISMKRSFSNGRFSVVNKQRRAEIIIPL